MADLMRPDDLKKISNDAEMKKAQEYLARARKQEEEQGRMRELFMTEEDVPPDAAERVNKRRPSRGRARAAGGANVLVSRQLLQ